MKNVIEVLLIVNSPMAVLGTIGAENFSSFLKNTSGWILLGVAMLVIIAVAKLDKEQAKDQRYGKK